jgi:hypothetical protein
MALYSSAKVGGVRGIFRSIDEGASWVRINDDKHQYGWTGKAVSGDPRIYGRVYVATNGRGIIYGDISSSSATAARIAEADFDSKQTDKFSVYPNPLSGSNLKIRFMENKNNEMDISITDVSGNNVYRKALMEGNFENNEAWISLPKRLSAGIYTVNLKTSTGNYTTKIVVE